MWVTDQPEQEPDLWGAWPWSQEQSEPRKEWESQGKALGAPAGSWAGSDRVSPRGGSQDWPCLWQELDGALGGSSVLREPEQGSTSSCAGQLFPWGWGWAREGFGTQHGQEGSAESSLCQPGLNPVILGVMGASLGRFQAVMGSQDTALG